MQYVITTTPTTLINPNSLEKYKEMEHKLKTTTTLL
jgi:hypothetical protein